MVSLKHLVSFVCVLLVAGFAFPENGDDFELPETAAPFVYLSLNENYQGDDFGTILRVSTDGFGSEECIFEDDYLRIEDMVIGPDGLLYVCANLTDPIAPLVFRLEPPAGPITGNCMFSLSDVEPVYEYDASVIGPATPVAPWFNFNGDLLVSDRDGAVWKFEGVSDVSFGDLEGSIYGCNGDDLGKSYVAEKIETPPTNCHEELFEEGSLVGLTQQAQGHLIVADSDQGVVWRYPMEISGEFVGPQQQLIPDPSEETDLDLNFPTGLARMSDGTIFVTDWISLGGGSILVNDDSDETPPSGGVLYMFPPEGADGLDPDVCWTFGGEEANFLEAESEDVIWLTTSSGLWLVEYFKDTFTCDVTQVYPTEYEGPSKAAKNYGFEFRGVAVPPTFREGMDVSGPAYEGLMFSQGDNALQVVADGECAATLQVYEALRADVEALVNILPEDAPEVMTDAFLGDNARFQVFDINPSNGTTCYAPVEFTISSFFKYDPATSGTAAMIHCTHAIEYENGNGDLGKSESFDLEDYYCENPLLDPGFPDTDWNWGGPLCCSVIPLSNFSLSGIIPDDGRRTGKTPAFSLLVAAEQPKKVPGDEGAGDYCGLKPPVKNNAFFGTPVPPGPGYNLKDFPTFKMGRTLPLKFNVVDYSDMSEKKKPKKPSCKKGPYLTDLTIALSITRIAKPEGEDWVVTSDMVDPIPKGKGYIDEYGRAIFGQSGSKYHFNWRLVDLEGPGIYEIFIIPDDANFTPAIEYVRIK